MTIWLLLDPLTKRVSIRGTEPGDGGLPRGPRGRGWKVREATLSEDVYAELLSGRMDDDEVDRLHRDLWTENGDTAWPN